MPAKQVSGTVPSWQAVHSSARSRVAPTVSRQHRRARGRRGCAHVRREGTEVVLESMDVFALVRPHKARVAAAEEVLSVSNRGSSRHMKPRGDCLARARRPNPVAAWMTRVALAPRSLCSSSRPP